MVIGMLKINISTQQITCPKVQQALEELLDVLTLNTSSSRPILHQKASNRNSSQFSPSQLSHSKTQIKVAATEVDQWLEALNPAQQAFVRQLRDSGKLTLKTSAQLLGIEPSDKSFKKHVNGSVGSIIRWSKKHYLEQVYQGEATWTKLSQVKLVAPWYCNLGVYYWNPDQSR